MRKRCLRAIGLLTIIILMMTVVLTGCQSKDSSLKGDNSKTQDNGKVNDKPEKKVKITFWHNYGADKETPYFAEVILPMFCKKFPNIEVEVVAQGNDQYQQLIVTAMGTNTTPDAARIDLTHLAGFAKQGALVALDDMEGFAKLKEGVFQSTLASNFYQGKNYGLPLDTNCKAAVFNVNNSTFPV